MPRLTKVEIKANNNFYSSIICAPAGKGHSRQFKKHVKKLSLLTACGQ